MEYDFRKIEQDWQRNWTASGTYKVSNDLHKPKYYVLDMFPYPSGAGLHVGHPLGYIASDIYSRYKRLKGFNVLHPMGFDSFGLPAEQYALETGQHPAATTLKNIATFKSQLNRIGFCYDWSREVQTSDPRYYKWTQWIFLQLFNSWYNRKADKAKPITELINTFQAEGSANCQLPTVNAFSAAQWNAFSQKTQEEVLMNYRLAFSAYGEVNWCAALGTVLANDEVVNGVSERGGHPVEKRKLRQWYLRITEYADRLLDGLNTVEFSDAMKEMQGNWIGKSTGAEIEFRLTPNPSPGGEGGEGPRHFQTADKKFWGDIKGLSRENRKEQTKAEKKLWEDLRNNQLGYKVRRQHVIGVYIIDFAFLERNLLIEVDGGYHEDEEQKKYDEARTNYLTELGYRVIRFTNDEVENNYLQTLLKIKEELNPEVPSPLSARRGVGGEALKLKVYTTRPDTIFGVDFMVIAPEHNLVETITTAEQKQAVEAYITYVKSRSERERIAEKKITGCFTGAYAVNPFNKREIPVWISEYVLAGYGTGAIMAVPCGDERDHKFARHFNIPITNIIGSHYSGEEANPTKEAMLENSDFINGLVMKDATDIVISRLEKMGIGARKVNYKMRDAAFSRQRYWGEPFPITWQDGIAAVWEGELPLELPHVDTYRPGPDAQGPLANIPDWVAKELETSTMPGYAGSSWYFLRYMDPHNDNTFCDRALSDYWNQVDLYIGGTEHAVGHLLYSRMWTKLLYDLGYLGFDEPFKKLLNQGMIQGSSRFACRITGKNQFVSAGLKDQYAVDELHVDVNIVDGLELDIAAFRKWKPEFAEAEFILEDGKFICIAEVEKMSKSKYNTVNPDELCDKYGADTFRMYEMFLGPVEASKPWDTKGIEGVHRFLRKLWRLFFDEVKGGIWNDEKATDAELKILHRTIKKIEEDTERFSFNTAVSTFMIAVNDLADLKCHKKEILQTLLILLAPYAPHISEELYNQLGSSEASPVGGGMEGAGSSTASPVGGGMGVTSVLDARFPVFDPKYLVESTKDYPVSINGKLRTSLTLALDLEQNQVETLVLQHEVVQKWLEGKQPRKIIFVKGKMINLVV